MKWKVAEFEGEKLGFAPPTDTRIRPSQKTEARFQPIYIEMPSSIRREKQKSRKGAGEHCQKVNSDLWVNKDRPIADALFHKDPRLYSHYNLREESRKLQGKQVGFAGKWTTTLEWIRTVQSQNKSVTSSSWHKAVSTEVRWIGDAQLSLNLQRSSTTQQLTECERVSHSSG